MGIGVIDVSGVIVDGSVVVATVMGLGVFAGSFSVTLPTCALAVLMSARPPSPILCPRANVRPLANAWPAFHAPALYHRASGCAEGRGGHLEAFVSARAVNERGQTFVLRLRAQRPQTWLWHLAATYRAFFW